MVESEDSMSNSMMRRLLVQNPERIVAALEAVKEQAVRDASFGDDRLLWLLHDMNVITKEEGAGWLEQHQHPCFKNREDR